VEVIWVFSGIIEACQPVERMEPRDQTLKVYFKRPPFFSDIKLGDSVAVNGVCLTVESLSDDLMGFSIGHETLKVTGWTLNTLEQVSANLERSLTMGDRIHGHLISGHVDGMGTLVALETLGENRLLTVSFQNHLRPYIWPKGSVAINGVSLTINGLKGDSFTVCLIPETLRRTNLRDLLIGDAVTLEVDSFARGMVHWLNTQGKLTWN